jgi:phosphoribosylformylglycinamidine synthase
MARDGAGIDVHLDRVPLREPDLEPWEIMISESQERMVAVVRPQMLESVRAVCERWELRWAAIGEVTETGELRAFHEGETLAEIPARLLTEKAPRYTVERIARPAPRPPRPTGALRGRLSAPNARNRRWIWEQYDHLVGSRTVRRPGLDAAVLRLRPSLRGLAVSLDGPAPGLRDPWLAGVSAVLESARNVACVGGEPLALTDCLNFGNPEKAEIGWELAEAIEGMAQAAEGLGVPVVSGNVSLYNETDGRPIPPTPVVGCVGLVTDVRTVPRGWREGDAVLLACAGEVFDLEEEAALVRFVWRAALTLSFAHDVSRDLETALAEAALWSGVGAEVELPAEPEIGAFVLACAPAAVGRLAWPVVQLGVVGGDAICGEPLADLRSAWESGA